jgi:hypothetical protein
MAMKKKIILRGTTFFSPEYCLNRPTWALTWHGWKGLIGLGKKDMKLKFGLEKSIKKAAIHISVGDKRRLFLDFILWLGEICWVRRRGVRFASVLSVCFHSNSKSQSGSFFIFLSVVSSRCVENNWASYAEYGISLNGTFTSSLGPYNSRKFF